MFIFCSVSCISERGRILEENTYYPDGLKIAGLCAKAFNKLPNEFGYQGNYAEEEEESGYDEFALRHYDPTIGRWLSTDPYDEFASPYVGMGADPVNNVDPDGGSIAEVVRRVVSAIGPLVTHTPLSPMTAPTLGALQPLPSVSASSAGSSGSAGGVALNAAGNMAAALVGQWIADKLFPLPSGPDAGQLQQHFASTNDQFRFLQASYVYEDQQPESDPKADRIRDRYKAMIADARKNDHYFAANNLQYFIDGKGGVKSIALEVLEQFDDFNSAVEVNKSRFEDQIIEAAENMRDGEIKTICDHWERKIAPGQSSGLYYASGKSQLSSNAEITLTKKGNITTIFGNISNTWRDPYNWNPGASAWIPGFGTVSDDDGIYLQQYGGAKPFIMLTRWNTSVSGTITNRRFWFDSSSIKWEKSK